MAAIQSTLHRLRVCAASQVAIPLHAIRFPVVGTQEGFVFRTRNYDLKGFLNVCVHRGLELDWDGDGDFFDNDGMIRCKAHDAKFDPISGVCVKGPRNCVLKKQLLKLEVTEADGDIYVENFPKTEIDFRKNFKIPGVALSKDEKDS